MVHDLPPTVEEPPPVPAYREAAPPADLAQVVACLWTRHGGDGETPTTRVVPDGCADLMWITDGGTARLVVAGPDTHAHLSTLGPDGAIAGLRFAPGAAADVLGVPLDAVRDTRPDLADLWGRSDVEAVAEAASASAQPEQALAAAVARRIVNRPDSAMRRVATELAASRHPAPVRGLAAELGLSERQLHRRCAAAFGYGPKTLHRVLRFQSALGLARAGRDLAWVAHECGYADQPHLARDVADLAGVSLTALLDR